MNTNVNTTITIPLNKLTAWKGNVRKTDADAGIDELAASIAAHGLLQSPVVKPAGKSGNSGKYAVIAGRRRFLALKALAKAGTIEADMPVPCAIASGEVNPAELSLVENIVRMPMHPADQFEAFRDLIDHGASVAEVAARFSIADSVVAKRLKLGRLNPVILAAYRNDDIGLEQAQAFAISDDHGAQERVLEALSSGHMSPASIRRALTAGEIPASDRRVQLIGLEAYAEAGGVVRRNLFDQDGGGYVLDEALLDRLVAAKLTALARDVTGEGWRWVEILPEIDYTVLSHYDRRRPERKELPETTKAELDALAAEYDELAEAEDDNAERLQAIDGLIEAINDAAEFWPAETLAIAGAVVALDHDGGVRIERGLVRPGDERAESPEAESSDGESESAGKANLVFSDALVADLTAQKTAAIRAMLSQRHDVALACVVHTLALQSLYRRSGGCLDISARSASLRTVLAKPEACRGLAEIEIECERWSLLLPGKHSELWDWCLAQPCEVLLALLALCAALSVDAVQRKGDRPACARLGHANTVSEAIALDIGEWFTPDADNLFSRMNRSAILAAIEEAKGVPAAPGWSKLKKAELAQLATRQVADTGWLPAPLRVAAIVEEDDEAVDGEDAEAEEFGGDDLKEAAE